MINFQTRRRTAKGVIWDGSPVAAAELITILTCPASVVLQAGGKVALTVWPDAQEPVEPELGSTILVSDSGEVGVFSRERLSSDFEPLAAEGRS